MTNEDIDYDYKEKVELIRDVYYCESSCPYLVVQDDVPKTKMINMYCSKYGDLDFYDWYIAKCCYDKD